MTTWAELRVPAAMSHCRGWQREVEDGHLSALVGIEDGLWHMSISHRTNDDPPQPGRIPTWEEIRDARYDLMPDGITVGQLLPPRAEYINVHDTTMHLWQIDQTPRMLIQHRQPNRAQRRKARR